MIIRFEADHFSVVVEEGLINEFRHQDRTRHIAPVINAVRRASDTPWKHPEADHVSMAEQKGHIDPVAIVGRSCDLAQ
jgi:hypothetical protein